MGKKGKDIDVVSEVAEMSESNPEEKEKDRTMNWVYLTGNQQDGRSLRERGEYESTEIHHHTRDAFGFKVNTSGNHLYPVVPEHGSKGAGPIPWRSPLGDLIAHTAEEGILRVYDSATGLEKCSFGEHYGTIWCCAFSTDGLRIVTGASDGVLKVCDPYLGICLHDLHGHTGYVLNCVFSKEGRFLASTSSDKTVKVWDVSTFELLKTLDTHRAAVKLCDFSQDGRFLVTVDTYGTLKIWDTQHFTELCSLRSQLNEVNHCSATQDGRFIASKHWNTLKVWEVANVTVVNSFTQRTVPVSDKFEIVRFEV
ncbi:hypothetical protein CYMTET_55399 [Cymbomonas tetramitiformis]|uniref:Uncharacterized protein n=1 Tax=Cymbomonas tetramitiformis TaxID=36881 RepID=A0AAE0BEE0_9CHLO|nr:hypothetical protein CYMTET_55399 [Cymbomonas tetramitiformis]